jgi:hypothetical protein
MSLRIAAGNLNVFTPARPWATLPQVKLMWRRCNISLAALPLLWLLAGCAGPSVSPTDQGLIDRADKLHHMLAPAAVESKSPRLSKYLDQLATRIKSAAKELHQQGTIKPSGDDGSDWVFGKDIDFHLVDCDLPNAFTSGGKHIYVYTGLMQLCRNEGELASMLCHEYAHLYGRHVLDDLRLEEPPSGGADAAVSYPYATLRISPRHAEQAEATALLIYTKAGWDPDQYISLYERLGNGSPAAGVDSALMRERASAAERRVSSLPPAAGDWMRPPIADDARFAQLLNECRALANSTSPPERTRLLLASFPSCLASGETSAQLAARERLFPRPAAPPENQWGKGVSGRGG